VKLAGAKVKAPKKKTLSLKLTSSEKVTGLVAQLRSKTKTVAKGKLASISGKATLKLKLAKKLKKGKYTLDLVGKDAAGQQRSTSAALTVR
jgi:methionine-rich copper-binding protein CopC